VDNFSFATVVGKDYSDAMITFASELATYKEADKVHSDAIKVDAADTDAITAFTDATTAWIAAQKTLSDLLLGKDS